MLGVCMFTFKGAALCKLTFPMQPSHVFMLILSLHFLYVSAVCAYVGMRKFLGSLKSPACSAGHRFRTTHDFGYVALDVLYTYAEDSGTYLCKAKNKVGEAVNSCSVNVSGNASLLNLLPYTQAGYPDVQSMQMCNGFKDFHGLKQSLKGDIQ